MPQQVTILGSTGSIGESALRVIRFLNDDFKVFGLSCNRNLELLEKQVAEFKPEVVAVNNTDPGTIDFIDNLKKKHREIEFLSGEDGIVELAGRDVDVLLSAIVGSAGLRPSVAAVGHVKRIALANKETLVMAGSLFMNMITESSTELVPVDSEHSAIFSLLNNKPVDDIERIILTASGGSLRNKKISELKDVTPEMALDHPTWDMGSKITIDSATLMNKGLEVIEARHLFNIDYDKISVVIHPESIIHSLVETIDGAMYGHMGVADMALPILNAFKYPERIRNSFGKLNLEDIGTLNFSRFDSERYPALGLCYETGKMGGTCPAVLNSANEIAVDGFLKGKILFTDIVEIVEQVLSDHIKIENPGLSDILNIDRETRIKTEEIMKGKTK